MTSNFYAKTSVTNLETLTLPDLVRKLLLESGPSLMTLCLTLQFKLNQLFDLFGQFKLAVLRSVEAGMAIGHSIKPIYLRAIELLFNDNSVLLLVEHVRASPNASSVELIVTVLVWAVTGLLTKQIVRVEVELGRWTTLIATETQGWREQFAVSGLVNHFQVHNLWSGTLKGV